MIMALLIALAGIPLYALTRSPAASRPEPLPAAEALPALELAVPGEARKHA